MENDIIQYKGVILNLHTYVGKSGVGALNKLIIKLKDKARAIKRELTALYCAYRHPGVPWYAKAITALVIGYALSPIDLIPDFIPILGYLDDLILIPAGITLALRMIPEDVMEECRIKAAEMDKASMGKSWIAAGIILVIWIILAIALIRPFIR